MSSPSVLSKNNGMIHDDRAPRAHFRVLGVKLSVQLVLMLLSFLVLGSLIVLALADWASRR
jgi:hypothetical protein